MPVLVEPLEADHRRMEAEAVAGLDARRASLIPSFGRARSTPRRRTARPCSAVVAAGSSMTTRIRSGCFSTLVPCERLRGERGGRAAQEERQPAPTPMP
jgi:hypothetical protein